MNQPQHVSFDVSLNAPKGRLILHDLTIQKTVESMAYMDDEAGRYIDNMTFTAMHQGQVVGALKAKNLKITQALKVGGMSLVSDVLDVYEYLSDLSHYVYGRHAGFLTRQLNRTGNVAYSKPFEKMARQCGYVSQDTKRSLSDFEFDLLYVTSLDVNNEYQGQGIGTRFMHALGESYNDLSKKDATFIVLQAFPFRGLWRQEEPGSASADAMLMQEEERLKQFYEANGFVRDPDSGWMLQTVRRLFQSTLAEIY